MEAIRMSEKVEQVAKAIYACEYAANLETEHPEVQKLLMRQARAAIEAMRVPNQAMTEFGFEAACRFDHGDTVPSLDIAEAVWQAMIDAALR
jgi:hypothetical protein